MNDNSLQYYQDKYQLDDLVAQLFYYNQLKDWQIQQLLQPLTVTKPPVSDFLTSIIDRIKYAQAENEKVVVVGDYDADGICATTIMVDTLRSLNIETGFYIPNRLEEGYGLSTTIVEQVASKDYAIIITVDNGVSAFEALELAKDLGLDVIVTDHHLLSDNNYDYDYLLHPSLLEERYQTLCGAGLALYLSRILLSEEKPYHWILAMIATIGDMVELFNENRVIVKEGLRLLNLNKPPHINSLIDYANGSIDEVTIAFQIVPKLNTVGRLADKANVNNVVRYFLSENNSEILRFAAELKELNSLRQSLTRNSVSMLNEVVKYGEFIVVIDDELHEGVLGLIANQLMNKHNCPVLVFSTNENSYKGSGRSPEGFEIYHSLAPLSDFFLSFGGHKQACGLEIAKVSLEGFLSALSEVKGESKAITSRDIVVEAKSLSINSVELLESFKPFGTGIELPLIEIRDFLVDECVLIKEKYIKWLNFNTHPQVEAITFKSTFDFKRIKDLKEMNFKGSLRINSFMSQKKVNIIVASCQISVE